MYAPQEVQKAKTAIRVFQARNPMLHPAVGWLARATDPRAVVVDALRQQPNASQLCALITSPVGRLALQALKIEAPEWRLVFDLLPVAAQAICPKGREGAAQQAVGAGLMVAGVGLLAYALKRGLG